MEAGRRLFARKWDFVTGVANLGQLPTVDGIEIAFAGRSNVGKSTLLNALTGQKNLARTSNTPGRTQQLNYFACDGVPLIIVDMPGYGYAKAPKNEVERWTRLVKGFLRGRATLRRVYVLIDARHGLKQNDIEILGMLDTAAVSYQLVLTKIDKISVSALDRIRTACHDKIVKRPAAHPEILETSGQKGTGIAELRAAITGLM